MNAFLFSHYCQDMTSTRSPNNYNNYFSLFPSRQPSITVYPCMSTVSTSLSLSPDRQHKQTPHKGKQSSLRLFGRQRFRFTH